MTQTIEAVYDGTVLRPDAALALKPNTRVRLIVETLSPEADPTDFLATAESLRLEGPADWATNLDKYLYGHDDQPRG